MRSVATGMVVRLASLMVPPERRAMWREEWRAELWHEDELDPLRCALGAFQDALAVRDLARTRSGPRDTMTTIREGVTTMGRDVKIAVRSLLRTPGFAVVAVVVLGLGIGGSTAIFALLDRMVLDPLPYPESDRLVLVKNQVPGIGAEEEWHASTAQYVFYDENARALEAVGIFSRGGTNVETPSGAQRALAVSVTPDLLPLLGAGAAEGRLLGPDDAADPEPGAVVLSHEFWTRSFGGDRSVLGTSLMISGMPVEVVGVMEPGLDLPQEPGSPAGSTPDLWFPMHVDRGGEFWNHHAFRLVGRMAPGQTAESVEAELAGLRDRLPARFPNAYDERFFERFGFRTVAHPLKDHVVGDMAGNLWILLGAVGLILLIAAANTVNLFLVRVEERRRELTVRAALGAGRGAILRYVLAESVVLSVAGGALAVLLAWQGLPWLLALAPDSMPRIDRVGLGGEAVALAALLSVVVGLAIGLLSALRSGPASLARGLAGGGRTRTSGPESQRLRRLLVTGQIALALMLVVGAGLLLESLRHLRSVDPGIDPEGVVVAELHLTPPFGDASELWQTFRRIRDGIGEIPGVTSVGSVSAVPLSGGYGCTVQAFEDAAVYDRLERAGQTTCAGQQLAGPGYFEAMGIPLLEGRTLTDADLDDPGRAAVVVSRAYAERFWPGESALGKRVAPSGINDGPFHTVVGVVGDIHAEGLEGQPALAVYYPLVPPPPRHGPRTGSQLMVVRTARDDPMDVVPEIRRVVASVDPTVPVADVRTMESVVEASMSRLAFVSLLLEVAAAVALLLAAVGLYGVVSYLVSRRTREIGMRLALGAQPGQVQRQVVMGALGMAVFGLAAGTLLAVGTTGLLESLLVGVQPTHPVAFGGAAVLLLAVGALAAWLPARRAARIDPATALRAE